MGICEISLWISNITPPPSRVLSFLYTLYGQDSGNNSEVDMELSIFVRYDNGVRSNSVTPAVAGWVTQGGARATG